MCPAARDRICRMDLTTCTRHTLATEASTLALSTVLKARLLRHRTLGGIAPPPGMVGPEGRPAFMGHAGNGFPPMMPYGTDMMHAANFDNYGRPAMGYGPMESYPPYGNNFGPSTPHSFHDSQSSAHPEDNGMYGQYPPPGALRNGGAVPGDDMHAQKSTGKDVCAA